MQIEFDVDGQRLIRTSEAYIIEGSEFFVECLFSFSSDWDELEKWAIFKRGTDTYEILIVGNRCIVPVECTAVEGEFTISLIGRQSNMLIIATTSEKLLYVRSTSHSNISYFDKAMAYIKEKAEAAAAVLKSVLEAKDHIDQTDYKIYVGETAPTEDITNAMVWINPAEDDNGSDELAEAVTAAQSAATSVQKYKALWFDSVAAMKAEPSLTAGAYVCTAGYYEPNDGGGASYLIREKLEADTDDGGSIHELQNGLVAELIMENINTTSNYKEVSKFLGCNIHPYRDTLNDISTYETYGFSALRICIYWNIVETIKGSYDWTEYDRIVALAESCGMRLCFVLAFNNTLYAESEKSPILTSDNIQAFKNYVQAVTSRYANKNITWEIWNEPENQYFGYYAPEQYVSLVKEVYPVIKENDNTSIVSVLVTADIRYYELCCVEGILNFTDKVSVHSYINNSSLEQAQFNWALNWKRITQKYSKKDIPIILSEFGYSTAENAEYAHATEEERSKYLVRAALIFLAYGYDEVYVYEARNNEFTSSDTEKHFGIFENNNSSLIPTSTAENIKAIFAELKDYSYVRPIAGMSGEYILEFIKFGIKKYVVWHELRNYSRYVEGLGIVRFNTIPSIYDGNIRKLKTDNLNSVSTVIKEEHILSDYQEGALEIFHGNNGEYGDRYAVSLECGTAITMNGTNTVHNPGGIHLTTKAEDDLMIYTFHPDGNIYRTGDKAFVFTESIYDVGPSYIRLSNGLQICIGDIDLTGNLSATHNFLVPFKDTGFRVSLIANSPDTSIAATISTWTNTSITVNVNKNCYVNYIAIGFWK